MTTSARTSPRIEWPTVGLLVAVYLAFGLLTWFHGELPLWALFLLGGYVVALHSSLQHEVTHGHPTPWRRVNEALVFPCLWLWLPFPFYRESHLEHHRDENLTLPGFDPESYYHRPEDWAAAGPLTRGFFWAMNSFAGRLLLAPLRNYLGAARLLGRQIAAGDRAALAIWARHLLAMALPLAWAIGICGLPLWTYLLCFMYAGSAISAIRSFLEHRAHPTVGERTVAVESGPLMGLLFLYNNLHILHHSEPGTPWYRLPARWALRRDELLALNGGYLYRGYVEVAWRYFFRAKEAPFHPGFAASPQAAPSQPAPVALTDVAPPVGDAAAGAAY